MADVTFSELYNEALKAYRDILTGKIQSYSIGGRNFTYHDINELWNQIQNLKVAAAEESNKTGFTTISDFRKSSNIGFSE